MKNNLIIAIMFCTVMFAGCSMTADKAVDDVSQEGYINNSSEELLQDVPESPTATDQKLLQNMPETSADTDQETSKEVQKVTAENNLYSADAQEIEDIVTEFCTAYFGGDLDSVKSFLTDQYIWDIDVYENSSNEVEIMAVKGLEDIGEKNVNDVCVVSVEYKEEGMDTCVYLTVEFIKTDKGWQIEFYGNEG